VRASPRPAANRNTRNYKGTILISDATSQRLIGLREKGGGKGAVLALAAAIVLLSSCSRKVTATPGVEAVPVVAATVSQKDVPVQLHAIGNVLPYSTVTVRAQVTGELTGVFFKEGQDVKKGDLLFTLDRRPYEAALNQAEGTLARDLAQAQNADLQARRYATLLEDGVVPKEQYDQMESNRKALEATVRADQAAVENAKVQLQYCSIYSPIDGRTGNLLANQGNLIGANNTSLVVINQVKPIYVSFALPESQLADVRKYASSGELKMQAVIPNEKPSEGALTFIDNAVDLTTGTIKLRGTFPNADELLWPGQFVDVMLGLTVRPRAIVVPSQAVQTGEQGQYVFVIQSNMTAELRPVTVDSTMNGQSVIAKGLQAGEQVVTDGQSRLTAGSKVELRPATP
jgi:multidrug efflux system membrane fusion protein